MTLCASTATLLAAALLAAVAAAATAAAAAAPRAQTEAKAGEALRALRSLSDAQKGALRDALVASAQGAVRGFLAHLEGRAVASEKGQEEELAAWAAAATAASGDAAEGSLSSILLEEDLTLAEFARRVLRDGLEELGVPPLDPFNVSSVPLDIDGEMVWLQGNLDNLSMDGLAAFQGDASYFISISIRAISAGVIFDLVVPRLRLRSEYWVNSHLAQFGAYVWGSGNTEIVLNNLRVQGQVTVTLRFILQPKVEPCDINVNANNVKVDIEGLYEDEQVSQMIGETITDVINEWLLDDFFDTLTNNIEEGVCSYLRSRSNADFLSFYIKYVRPVTMMHAPASSAQRNANTSGAHFSSRKSS